MTTKQYVSWVVVGVLGFLIWRKAKNVYQRRDDWDYDIESVKLKGLSPQKILLTFGVRFINKTGLGATIRNLKFKFYIENILIGDCYVPTPTEIPGDGSKVVPIDVLVEASTLKGNLVYIVNKLRQEGDFPVRIAGTFDVQLPFESWITIPLDFTTTARYLYSLFSD
jgi:LEA14-like dessication related protein